jgi:hypothetical protein
MSRKSTRTREPSDVRVCPACQAYNLHDATRCFLCGQPLAPAELRKPASVPPPPLSDPELDHAPAPRARGRDDGDDDDSDDGIPAPFPNAETPPDPTTRVALGFALFLVVVGLFRVSPVLAIVLAAFLGAPILRALRGRSGPTAPRPGAPPSVLGFLGRTVVALVLVGFVFVVALVAVFFSIVGAILD